MRTGLLTAGTAIFGRTEKQGARSAWKTAITWQSNQRTKAPAKTAALVPVSASV